MRMLFPLLALTVVLLGPGGCGSPEPPADTVIRVNDKGITAQELGAELKESRQSINPADLQAFVERTVTREVLIQEALRRGMDREESFRKALKNYYEQNLIKNVTDRIAEETPVAISDAEVRRAYEDMERILRLRVQRFDTAEDAGSGGEGVVQEMEVMVGDLPRELEDSAFGLSRGERSPVIRAGANYYRLTLLDATHAPMPAFESVRENIRTTLEARKRMEEMNASIDALRGKASVVVDEERLQALLKGEE